jgi:hypothetical protein
MIDEHHIELINREIDGEISADDHEELMGYLDTHPEARDHYNELREIGHLFDEAGDVDPPTVLRQRILAHTGGTMQQTLAVRSSRSFFDLFRGSFRPAHVFAVSIAVIVAIGAFVLVSQISPRIPPGDSDRFMGSMTDRVRDEVVGRAGPIGISLPTVAGTMELHYLESAILARIHLETASEIRVVLRYEENVTFEGYHASDDAEHAMDVSANRVALTHAGERDYDILLLDPMHTRPPIRIEIWEGGSPTFEQTIGPGPR